MSLFSASLSGLNAAQNMLSVTGNNVANANTTGFKQSRSEFSDMYAASVAGVTGVMPGAGIKVASAAQQFAQGNAQYTENNLDLSITGEGFFVLGESVDRPLSLSYSRDGAFSLDANGYVVNNSGNTLMAYKANDPNDVSAGFSTGVRQAVQMNTAHSAPKATGTAFIGLNLDARATAPTLAFDSNNPLTYNYTTSTNIYDSLGVSHTLTTYYQKLNPDGNVPGSGPGTIWHAYADVDNSGVPSEPAILEFNSSGIFVPPTVAGSTTINPMPLSVELTNGATTPMVLNVDFTGTTQFSATSAVDSLSQDGYTSGNLIGVAVDKDGVLFARYSNGASSVMGQVAMAKFTNPQGLAKLGDTRWGETAASGTAILGQPNTGDYGFLQSGALEGSNVDIATQLVQLILAQQYYQANTQAIQTENQIVQSLLQIR